MHQDCFEVCKNPKKVKFEQKLKKILKFETCDPTAHFKI